MQETDSLIHLIAFEIFNETILTNYRFYLIISFVSLVSASIVALGQSYFKKRGETFATKADFDEILRQLSESTTITESIKSELQTKFSNEQTTKTLIREKLEIILEQTFELELWCEQSRGEALKGDSPDVNGCPIERIEMLQILYFRDLRSEQLELRAAVGRMIKWILELSIEALNAKSENRSTKFNMSSYTQLQGDLLRALSSFRGSIIEKYSKKGGI